MKKNLIVTRLWERAVDLLVDSVVGTLLFFLTVALIATGVGTLPAMGVGLILLWIVGLLSRATNSMERARVEAMYGVRIPPPVRRRTTQTGPLRFAAQPLLDLVDPVTWRTLLSNLISMVLGLVMLAIFSGGCRLVILSGRSGAPYLAYLFGIACLAGLLAYIYFAGVLDEQQSVALLGPSATATLEHQVGTLDAARRGAVDAASLERERIERNLHDGIQPQMVSVAMTLGMARAKMDADPQAAKLLLDEAHAEAKASINELRQMVRGFHPAVLADRGLDAAISAVAARCRVPAVVTVTVPDRPAAEAEAVIYFAVAEALTNIDKHSSATACSVTVTQVTAPGGCRLVAMIADNGSGGAAIGDGLGRGGLAGMRDRLLAAGGTLRIVSPAGGPTTITVEVPCAS